MATVILFLIIGIIIGTVAGVFIASLVIAALKDVEDYGYYEFNIAGDTYHIEKK